MAADVSEDDTSPSRSSDTAPPAQEPADSEHADQDSQTQDDAPTSTPSPHPPGSSASIAASVADSISTATPTLGGSNQTQVNVVNREFTPRPSTDDKPSSSQFYANLSPKQHGATDETESMVSRSTAQRTNFSSSMGGPRRSASRSHVPAIIPAYSFYHPLRPPAVANASAQQQIPETKPTPEADPQRQSLISQHPDEISSVHGKPSSEPLLPRPAPTKQESRPLHTVIETASNRTSILPTQLLAAHLPSIPPATALDPANSASKAPPKTRNWQHFPGKTKYHLNGRVQFGTQYWANIGTAASILIPAALYFAFT
jgi:hypothetical protein